MMEMKQLRRVPNKVKNNPPLYHVQNKLDPESQIPVSSIPILSCLSLQLLPGCDCCIAWRYIYICLLLGSWNLDERKRLCKYASSAVIYVLTSMLVFHPHLFLFPFYYLLL